MVPALYTDMEILQGIYLIQNSINGKMYIGQSKNMYKVKKQQNDTVAMAAWVLSQKRRTDLINSNVQTDDDFSEFCFRAPKVK